jgi:DNA-binding SARP family transcriptional activator
VAACRLNLLGGFDLVGGDGRLVPLPTRKDRLLLAYLALNAGRQLARERLAGLLWANRAEAQARDSLKQSLAGIRQAFRQACLDPLHADRETVTLAPDGIDIDALEFARLAGAPAEPERAVLLYRGELLEGVDAVGADLHAWLVAERARLEDLAVRVLEQLAHPIASMMTGSGSDAFCTPVTRCASRCAARSCGSLSLKATAPRR